MKYYSTKYLCGIIVFLLCPLIYANTLFAGQESNVKTIHNSEPKWGNSTLIELEFVQSIGGAEVEDEDYEFFQSRDALKDTQGNIYILDTGNHRVKKFNKNGRFINSIGRSGQGPGELSTPTGMLIDNDNILQVVNTRNYRIEQFSLNGDYLSSFPMEKMYVMMRRLTDNKIVAPIVNMGNIPGLPSSSGKPSLISILNNKGEIQTNFGEVIENDTPLMKLMINSLTISPDSKGNIYAVFSAANKIEKYDSSGKLLLIFDRPLPFKVESKMEMRAFDIQGTQREFPFPKWTFVSAASAVDSQDRLWVSTFHEQPELPDDILQLQNASFPENQHIEIYDGNGVWLGKFTTPEGMTLARIQGNIAFFYNKDLTSISEYRIVEK